MRVKAALLAATLGLASAHGERGQHVPKLVGGKQFLPKLTRSDKLAASQQVVHRAARKKHEGAVSKRQGLDARCGSQYGSCGSGLCCSAEGYCGSDRYSCTSPDCQIQYGPGCDGNKRPSGVDTSSVARKKIGSVLYGGAGIYDCVNEGEIAVTFDDGPYLYTNDLLDKLKSYGARATFFITGTNLGKGQINDPATPYPSIIRRMNDEGHQIASHTWSHENASQLTDAQFTTQMIWNEVAINSILGFFPTYMRPPYSICESKCQSLLFALGYHIVYFDMDTEGYLSDSPELIQNSKNIWDNSLRQHDAAQSSFLQIEHDIHWQVVYNLTDYVLTSLFAKGYKSVTVGDCLGDPKQNWYRAGPGGSLPSGETGDTPSPTSTGPTSSSTLAVSQDGSCGADFTCQGSRYGDCCSQYNYCGSTDGYCLNGCQPTFGTCGGGGK